MKKFIQDSILYLRSFFGNDGRIPSKTLHDLIREVESSAGNDRTDARMKAKAWLLSHGSSMGQNDILLARNHFWYLLPSGWGGTA
jgi:hypothetical protein